jgi:nickel-dependent lactate racemase
MTTVAVPWGAWYANTELELDFPGDWTVRVAAMKDAPDVDDGAIRRAFEAPIGTPPIRELARGKRRVVITADDLTRPTQAHRFIPVIIRELEAAGVRRDDVTFVMSFGAHRPMTRDDLIKKLGAWVVDGFRVYNHHPYENLVSLGKTSRGTPLFVNRTYHEADLKICNSFITPHPIAGFGGGAKAVLPGVSGIETLQANHTPAMIGKIGGIGFIEGNEHRADLEEAARMAGLDVSVNAVGTSRGATAGVFVGDFIEAHRAAVALARQVYATRIPEGPIDVGIFNAFPKDNEFIQASNAFNVWSDRTEPLVRPGGTLVLMTAGSEGRGFHSLADTGMRLAVRPDHRPAGRIFEGRQLIVFCPNVSPADVSDLHPPGTVFCKKWQEVIDVLGTTHGAGTHAVVFPCGTLQLSKRTLARVR